MFELAEIKNRAGDRFSLGKALYESGKVSRLSEKKGMISATVRGQHKYQVFLSAENDHIFNSCTCPAADFQDFCKHCVAVALAANNISGGEVSAEQSLIDWFGDKPKDELVTIIMGYLDTDHREYDRWMLKLKTSSAKMKPADIRKLVTKALPKKNVWDWHEVSRYFENAEQMLDTVYEAMTHLKSDDQWKLVQHIYKRLNEVLERVDDSGGYRLQIEQDLYSKMAKVFSGLTWSDGQKAQWLVDMLSHEYDLGPEIPDGFELTKQVEDLFYEKCETTLKEGLPVFISEPWRKDSVAGPLIQRAETSGNWRELIRIKQMLATNSRDFLELCQICLDNGHEFDAEDWLIRAQKVAKSEYDKLEARYKEVDVRIALDELEKAWELAWGIYNDQPSFEGYLELETVARQTNTPEAAYISGVEKTLLALYTPPVNRFIQSYRYDDVLGFYIHLKKIDLAIEWAKEHDASRSRLLELASLLIAEYPVDALAFYQRGISAIISDGNNQAYREAFDILLSVKSRVGNSCEAFKAMLKELAVKHKQKRNMMALLKGQFSDLLE